MGHAELTLQEQATTRQISLDEYWMPFTPNREFKADPRMIVRAEGMYFWSDKGAKIIDASSGLFCCAAGHGRREIAEAVGRQLAELDFSAPFLRGHPKQFELATRIAELTPGDLNRIFYGNSGSEAVDTAMKVALAYHQARGPGRAQHLRVAGAGVSRRQLRRRIALGARQQPSQVRPGASGHRPHASHAPQGELLHAGRRRARRRARRGPAAFRQPVWRREHRGVLRRADRRVDGMPRAAEGLPQAPARDLRRARDPARLRRGDHRVRAHRTGVRRAELRRHAGHDHDGQGTHQRRAADERGGRERAHPRHDQRSRPPKARSSSSTGTPTRAIPRPARRGLRRSTSTGTTACSSAAARCRRTSRTRSSRCATFRRWPTSAATGCSPRSTCTRREHRVRAVTRCRRSSSTTASISRRPATARSSRHR